MSETKQPDWDKITEGKIRHGFAVAAFTSGMQMTDDLCQNIEMDKIRRRWSGNERQWYSSHRRNG